MKGNERKVNFPKELLEWEVWGLPAHAPQEATESVREMDPTKPWGRGRGMSAVSREERDHSDPRASGLGGGRASNAKRKSIAFGVVGGQLTHTAQYSADTAKPNGQLHQEGEPQIRSPDNERLTMTPASRTQRTIVSVQGTDRPLSIAPDGAGSPSRASCSSPAAPPQDTNHGGP